MIIVGVLEKYVFGKLYFECEGLIVVEEVDRCIGYVYVGFGFFFDG